MINATMAKFCPEVTVVARGPRYSAAELLAAFPPARLKYDVTTSSQHWPQLTEEHEPVITKAADRVSSLEPMLWQGDWAKVTSSDGTQAYLSQSEADFALAKAIAQNLAGSYTNLAELPPLAEAVFFRSGLARREKWQTRQNYRMATVNRACAIIPAPNQASTLHAPLVDWDLQRDVRTARLFADMWQGSMLYVPENKRWLEWRDDRWAWCTLGEATERAKAAAVYYLAEASKELARDPDRGKRLVRDATNAHDRYRLDAMLALARSEPLLVASQSELDCGPYLLGVGNGVVSLHTGTLQANHPDLRITRHCNANFDNSAPSPRWLQFLDEVFNGDQATIRAVQLLAGYTLVGTSSEEIMLFCVGFGANGKSIFANVLSEILGDYAMTAPPSLLGPRRSDDHGPRNDIAMLDGARLVSINELPYNLQLDEQVVKQLAGREPITARFLNKEHFTFQPRFTAWVRTNHKPIVKGDDDGIWRRIVIVPFCRKFASGEQDPHLENKLLAERNGILGWMIAGAQGYLRSGLKRSPKMEAERAQYRKESDLLGEFLDEVTVLRVGKRAEQQVLYTNWDYWCRQNGHQPGSKKSFTQRLAERGHPASKSNSKRFYDGLDFQPLFSTGREGPV